MDIGGLAGFRFGKLGQVHIFLAVHTKSTKKVAAKSAQRAAATTTKQAVAKIPKQTVAKSTKQVVTRSPNKTAAKPTKSASQSPAARLQAADPTSDAALLALPREYEASPDMPVTIAQAKLAALSRMAQTVAGPLAKVGITRQHIETLGRFAKRLGLVETHWQKARTGVALSVADRKRLLEAEALDQKLLAGARWACRKDGEALIQLNRIAEGSGRGFEAIKNPSFCAFCQRPCRRGISRASDLRIAIGVTQWTLNPMLYLLSPQVAKTLRRVHDFDDDSNWVAAETARLALLTIPDPDAEQVADKILRRLRRRKSAYFKLFHRQIDVLPKDVHRLPLFGPYRTNLSPSPDAARGAFSTTVDTSAKSGT